MKFARARSVLHRLAILAAAVSQLATAADAQSALENLDEAILNDIMQAYATYEPSSCTSTASTAATSVTFDWPGTNTASEWFADFEGFEESNFQAMMTHTDVVGDNTWSIRIGTSGNIYSHFVPNQYGETLPPQDHPGSPWIDEVQQSVSVNRALNKRLGAGNDFCPGPNTEDKAQCKPYFIHQAGAYQEDSPTTDVPFFSPSLANHCSSNSCIFASWGTQAHVETPFTSPIMYINKYTNCDDGIIEHTQMIHNFAKPSESTATNVDQTYFNVGWGGVRASTLPIALEPDPTTGALDYIDVNDVDYLPLCKWGNDAPNTEAGRAARTDLKNLGGYTSFVEDGLLVNLSLPEIPLPCRKANLSCYSDSSSCMKESCTDGDIANGDVRMTLKIAANGWPNCAYNGMWNGLVELKCDMHDRGFGQTTPYLQGAAACYPWTDIGFFREDGEGIDVAYVRHWSWSPNNSKVYFAVYSTVRAEAINMVNNFFDNRGNSDSPLLIDVRPTSNIESVPVGYNPSALNAFTFVYGKGEEYDEVGGVEGKSRRRVGSSGRDYTVFTINWYSGSRLQAGSTYTNRGFYFNSNLANVKATAEDLVTKTSIDEIATEQWLPRKIDIYRIGSQFAVLAASSSGGQSTTCSSANHVCSGTSTPEINKVPFFYTTCGELTHFGPDPYHFTPPFGDNFPGHGNMNNMVRSYVCNGQDISIRPSWKLMGFFDPDDSECTSLADLVYEETACPAVAASETPSEVPSVLPTLSPSDTPSVLPSDTPSETPTGIPSDSPSEVPSAVPTLSPSDTPSSLPSDTPSATPTGIPSDISSTAPSSRPSISPSESSANNPSAVPTSSSTVTPTATDEPTPGPSSTATDESTPGPTSTATDESTPGPSSTATDESTPGPSSTATDESTPGPTSTATDEPTPGPTSTATFKGEEVELLTEDSISCRLGEAVYFEVNGGEVWAKITDLKVHAYRTRSMEVYYKYGDAAPFESTPCSWKKVAETSSDYYRGWGFVYPTWTEGFKSVVLPPNEKVSFYIVVTGESRGICLKYLKKTEGHDDYSHWIGLNATSPVGGITLSNGRRGYKDKLFKPHTDNWATYGIYGGLKLETMNEGSTSSPTPSPTESSTPGSIESPLTPSAKETFRGLQFEIDNLRAEDILVTKLSVIMAQHGRHHLELWYRDGSYTNSESGCHNWNNWCDQWKKVTGTDVVSAGPTAFTATPGLIVVAKARAKTSFAIVSPTAGILSHNTTKTVSATNADIRINLATPINDYYRNNVQTFGALSSSNLLFQGEIDYEVVYSECAIQSKAPWVVLDPEGSQADTMDTPGGVNHVNDSDDYEGELEIVYKPVEE